ncbi:MAG: DUF5658 family protein [Planctomycetota bacterium]|jgi:hypothetical protein
MTRPANSPTESGRCSDCGLPLATCSVASCPDCGGPIVSAERSRPSKIGWLSLPPIRYLSIYGCFIVVASLDIVLTWAVLRLGGTEENVVAAAVIGHRGLVGMVLFKFSLVLLIIVMCEVIGRRRDEVGRKLAKLCVAITAVPVLAACAELWMAGSDAAQPKEAAHQVVVLPDGSPGNLAAPGWR